MIPVTYKMIDLDGLDLAEINGGEVPGIYNKIASAYSTSRFAIMCNWFFAGIIISPAHVLISQVENGFLINDLISVKSDDTVEVLGLAPEPVIEELEVTENGTYYAPAGVNGYSPVIVNVQVPLPYDSMPSENGTGSPGESSQWSRGDHSHPITIENQNAVIPSGVSGLAFRDNNDNSKKVIKIGNLVIVNISLRAQDFTFTVTGEASAWNTMIELPWPASVIPWFVGAVGLREDGATTDFVDVHGVNLNNKLCLTVYGNRTMRAVNRSFSFNFCYLTS